MSCVAAADVPMLLYGKPNISLDESVDAWVARILCNRARFGITRLASVTRLDWIGIHVAQAIRPESLFNVVSQGKGLSTTQAAASALMECLEGWAGERTWTWRTFSCPASHLGQTIKDLYKEVVVTDATSNWDCLNLEWINGWDLLSEQVMPVPTALVDTRYTIPSRHPHVFPRVTTGLGAGRSMIAAVIHAVLEILERHAVSEAHNRHGFFDDYQINLSTVEVGDSADILDRIKRAGMLAGAWRIPVPFRLPVYWCHVMESESVGELVPLPAEGFSCDFTEERALARALLEACQARVTAIAGSREDLTRRAYPDEYDRPALQRWRDQLLSTSRSRPFSESMHDDEISALAKLDRLRDALICAGSKSTAIVPLFNDGSCGIHVVRVVAPPLRDPGAS
jgi:ribosomal protein S12 methylthiotransferase accessory factor